MNFKNLSFEKLEKKTKEELKAIKKEAFDFLLKSRFKKVFSSLDNSKMLSLTKKLIARIETIIKR